MIARSVVENIATALTNNHRIEVMFRGSDCFTDGKLIVLPSLPDQIPGKLIEMIRGFLDHEVAHILFSDFSYVKKADKKGRKDGTPLRFILNAVEDIRIEREMAKVYRGCGVNFDKSRDYTIEKLKKKWDEAAASASDEDPVLKTMIFFMFAAQLGWDAPIVTEYATDIMPLLEHLAPEIEATESLSSTEDAFDLAKVILEKIETFSMPEPESVETVSTSLPIGEGSESEAAATATGPISPSDGSGSGSYKEGDMKTETPAYKGDDELEEKGRHGAPSPDKADGSSDDDSPGSAGSKDDEADETPSEKAPPTAKPESTPSADDSKDDEGVTAGDEKDKDEEPLKALKEKLKKALEEKDKDRALPSIGDDISKASEKLKGYRPYSTARDTFEPHEKAPVNHYDRIAQELTGIVTTLRGRLTRILLSQKRSRWDGNKRKGLLNPSQLHQVITKTSESIYRTRKEGAKMNTAVEILIDLSGSMSSRIRRTQETAILLAETLAKIGIAYEILGFSGDHSSSSISSDERRLFNRWGSLNMFYFKKFDERYGQEQKERIAGMHAHRENYDGESVLFAANRLRLRGERKKILFVLSDGHPAAGQCRYETLNAHLKKVVADIEADPTMTVIGFGMQTSAPKEFYKNHLLINDLSRLPETLMTSLYKQLA